jgi:hypothetical protein
MPVTRQPSKMLYTPPAGYYDLPMIWVFDASQLVNGNNYPNQNVPIYAGYGDFLLRRVAGLDRVLSNAAFVPGQQNPPGQFHLRDAQDRYLESLPTYINTGGPGAGANSRDIAIVPEVLYKENTNIPFDLYDVLKASDASSSSNFSAQIAFCGVRRFFGTSPLVPTYKFRPKSYTYTTSQRIIPVVQSGGGFNTTQVIPILQKVFNYDFELYQILITYDIPASANQTLPFQFSIVSNTTGLLGNGQTLVILPTLNPNQQLTITVAGSTVTVLVQTDGSGNVLTQAGTLATALNAAQSLFTAATTTPIIEVSALTLVTSGAGPANVNTSQALFQLYDQNRVQVWSNPVADVLINGLAYNRNGALVPPIFYRQSSNIEIDVSSLQKNNPLVVNVNFVGRQRIPC